MVTRRLGTCSVWVWALGLLVVLALLVALALGQASAADKRTVTTEAETAGDEVNSKHSTPHASDVEALLGVYTAGRETLTLRWQDDALILDLDRISVPVDGLWHETVPTFAVRHRVGWVAERRVLTLEEQHNEGVHWRYELRFQEDRLDKVEMPPAGNEETVVRSYRRRP